MVLFLTLEVAKNDQFFSSGFGNESILHSPPHLINQFGYVSLAFNLPVPLYSLRGSLSTGIPPINPVLSKFNNSCTGLGIVLRNRR